MSAVAANIKPDRRRASRFPVDQIALFEKSNGEEFKARITNVSAHGFMVDEILDLEKGDRLTVRLPVTGQIESYMVWAHNGRTGFEFERIIRLADFMQMLDQIGG